MVFDTLYRLLRHVYGADHVTYVRNFTDVDDKINATALARKSAGDARTMEALIAERTEETIGWYHADMDALGALRPNHEPRATEYIPQMIEMIETLIRKGFAYSKPVSYGHNSRAVYFKSKKAPEHSFFQVEQFKRYGELSGRSLDEMISGAKAEVGEGKMNPMDFVLWKPSTVEEPGWHSPWGYGRPGWHIECSAMSKALLGDVFDIHGGGLDLQFPHHENEIAQSCCANDTQELARFWMHNEMLQVEGKKMSKSLGNFFTVRDLLEQGVPGEVIRFVYLSTHYRKPMDWTSEKARNAFEKLKNWRRLAAGVSPTRVPNLILDALGDDLNTFEALRRLDFLAEGVATRKIDDPGEFVASANLLGLLTPQLSNWSWKSTALASGAISIINAGDGTLHDGGTLYRVKRRLWDLRAVALETRNFSEFDAFKNLIIAAGVGVKIGKDDVELSPHLGFDPAKLEALK